MIIDLEKFLLSERPFWTELETQLDILEENPNRQMTVMELKHFHHLYQRASADLGKIVTFASEPETRQYLESLVARAYGEIHDSRDATKRPNAFHWFFVTLPQTFRRHHRAFWMAVAITMAGCLFGGIAVAVDPDAKPALMPFSHLKMRPSERVAEEEHATKDRLEGEKGGFSASLMTHNIKVSVFTLALGMTWGAGSLLMLFYNGVILGAVASDYILDGQSRFLAGWLLPHGSFEIPAILIAGQAGLILGRALIGWGTRDSIKSRLRAVSRDVVTLAFGMALLLVWAGLVESFLSQYHEPVLPYSFKIIFGAVELSLLCLWLGKSGSGQSESTGITEQK